MAKSRATSARTLVALLRAVNVGGTGKLAMRDLALLCTRAGFTDVRTYIQSGNVVFQCALPEAEAQRQLEGALARHMGRPVDVVIRTAEELRRVVRDNPYPDAAPSHLYVFFSTQPVPAALFEGLHGPDGETARARGREVYVHYPVGMGASKFKLPKWPVPATARNMNTVAKLAGMCEGSRDS
jgi:uncharacterized protein (DUF1697 family)